MASAPAEAETRQRLLRTVKKEVPSKGLIFLLSKWTRLDSARIPRTSTHLIWPVSLSESQVFVFSTLNLPSIYLRLIKTK
nr:small G protein signaling modulator 1-like [Pongo pygmaeus]